MRSFNSFMFFTLTLSLILKYPLYSLIDPDSSISFALVDGPSYHTQVNIILEENRLVWALDPLSYIGLYPMSSPLGLQTFAASLCLLLNMEVSSIAFLLSFYLTIVQFFSVFLLSRLFFRNNLINVTSASAYTNFWYFIQQGIWSISARIFFVTLLPLVLYALLRPIATKTQFLLKDFFLLLLLIFILFSSHRMSGTFVLFFLIPFALVNILKRYKILFMFPDKISRSFLISAYLLSFLILLLALYDSSLFPDFIPDTKKQLNPTSLGLEVFGPFQVLLEYFAVYTTQSLLLFLSIFGLSHLFLTKNKYNSLDFFIIFCILFQIRFSVDSAYVLPIFALILTLGLGYALDYAFKLPKMRISIPAFFIVIILILLNFSFTAVIKEKNLSQNNAHEIYEGIDFKGEGILPEEETSALWFEEHIGYDSRVIGDSTHSRAILSSVTPIKNMFAGSLIYDSDSSQVFIIERFSLWHIFTYEGPHGYYGGNVKEVTLGSDEINSHFYQEGIMKDYALRDLYMEGFKVEYILDSNVFNDNQAFLEVVEVENYPVYRNELYTYYYYYTY